MIVLVVLWLLVAMAEGLAYGRLPRTRWRPALLLGLLIALIASSGLLVAADWPAWTLAAVLSGYRAVNLLRFRAARLAEPQLRSVALRAHGWLVAAQVVSVLAVGVVMQTHSWRLLLAAIAGLQLLAAVALLRSSLHSWRHAEPFVPSKPLGDSELPALSVLVPARNETDALDACLRRLIASDYPKLEIVVFDDNSANRRTPEIIRSFAHDGVRFITGGEVDDPRWLAKNLAYERLRQEASGELLLFCGVDAQLEPSSLRHMVEVLVFRHKDMLSVLPLKAPSIKVRASLLQPMRYFWELCLPRRFFKRPPVLSTCWLARAALLERAGGFEAVSRSIAPESHFARQAVVTDAYSFIRSNAELGIYSAKPVVEQYDTSVRVRYPQLHRRLELVALATLLELLLFIGPLIGLCLIGLTPHPTAYTALWITNLVCLAIPYYLVAVNTRLNNPLLAWLLMPLAFLNDIVILHISLYKYEFSRVIWKDRDIAIPVMQVIPHLPRLG